MINVALFGMTAKQWREANPGEKGNMRDYASLNQLLVLANMHRYLVPPCHPLCQNTLRHAYVTMRDEA